MKKWNNLSESNFLKLFFGIVTAAFLVAAVCMPDRGQMFAGLWDILTNPTKLSTNYFSFGFAATFLNMGLVALAMTALFCVTKTTVNNVSTLAFLLTLGFCSWGINILNMWLPCAGVVVGNLIKKEKIGANVNAMLFSTGVAPIVSEMLFRYPGAEVVGFNVLGVILAIVTGIAAGILIPAGLPHSPNVHKGLNMYSAGLPVGMTAFLFNGILYKAMGIDVPGAVGDVSVASAPAVNIFCLCLFGLFVVVALLMGCTPKAYWDLLKNPGRVANVSGTCGNAVFLMNAGIYGLFILAYYNAIGATFNGVVLGLVLCMLSCCNSGARPSNVWPIMLGYVVASFGFGWLSGLVGGNFSLSINAAAIAVGLCFASGLAPICDQYGWFYGFIAAIIHYGIVTLVPSLHGGFALYNGGFTAVFVCIILVPVLEKFCKTKEARKAAKAETK